MKNGLLAIIVLMFASHIVYAHGNENHAVNGYSFGAPAKEADATRTINIEAKDNEFVPSEIAVRQGETIKFVITNTGKHVHDFNIGDIPSQREHALMMEKMPDMHHENDPTARTINRGETKTIAWTFDKRPTDPIEIDCLELGHDSMSIKVVLTN